MAQFVGFRFFAGGGSVFSSAAGCGAASQIGIETLKIRNFLFDILRFAVPTMFQFHTSGGAYMKHDNVIASVGRATVPADTGRHGGRPYDRTRSKFFSIKLTAFEASGGARMILH
jgi:hypothetical protein